ncbi:MAG: hypothetical protein ABSB35_30345, partial [Bryobacteraceae bacterium]
AGSDSQENDEEAKTEPTYSTTSGISRARPALGALVVRIIQVKLAKEDPEPHGLDIYKGALWYCDAASSWVCRLV